MTKKVYYTNERADQLHAISDMTCTVLEGSNVMRVARMSIMAKSLKLEILGMKRSKGPTMYSLIKREFGLRGNRESVLQQFNEPIKEERDKLNEQRTVL